MSKRILSLALVVMMLAAFIPSALFSASAAGDAAYQFKYDFKVPATCDVTDNGMNLVKKPTTRSGYYYTNSITDYAMTYGAWKFHSASQSEGVSYGVGPSDVIYTLAGDNRYLALDLNVPVSGTFDVTINYTAAGAGVATDYFLVPAGTNLSDIANIQNAPGAIPLSQDFAGAANTSDKTEDVIVTAGEYILVCRLENNGKSVNFRVGGLTFTASGATEGEYITPYVGTIDPVAVKEGATATPNARIFTADGNHTAYTGDVTYVPENASIATGAVGAVTGVKEGTTALGATLSDGAVGNVIGEVTVLGPAYQFKYDLISAVLDKTTGLGTISNTVNSTPDPRTITHYAMTKGGWKYHDSYGYRNAYGVNVDDTIFAFTTNVEDCYVALDINVPVSGRFDINLKHKYSTNKADYVLVPAGTSLGDVANIANAEGAIALAKGYSGASNASKVTAGVNLTKGEYMLVVYLYNDNLTGTNRIVRFSGLEMTASGATEDELIQPYVGTIDPITLKANGTATAKARVFNAYTHEAITSGISFTSDDENTASVSGTTVTGVNGGSTKLNAEVSGMDGNIIPGDVTVTTPAYRFQYVFSNSSVFDPATGESAGASGWYPINSNITNYGTTRGLWKYFASSYTYSEQMAANRTNLYFNTGAAWFAIKINVPASSTYDITYNDYGTGHSAVVDMYILPGTTTASEISAIDQVPGAEKIVEGFISGQGTKTVTKTGVQLEKGEYVFVFKDTNEKGGLLTPVDIQFKTSGATTFDPVYVGTVNDISIFDDGEATVNANIYDAWNAPTEATTKLTEGYTIDIDDDSVASLDGTTVKPAKDGITEITASVTGAASNIIPGKLTVASSELAAAYNATKNVATQTASSVSALAVLLNGDEDETVEVGAEANGDGTYKMTAPEKDGYEFLYWVKGAATDKKIVSFDAEFDYSPSYGGHILIAVYDRADAAQTAKVEFYNANGQLVESFTENGTAPEIPGMPGLTASHWQNTDDVELGAGEAFTVTDGTVIWVAQYAEDESDIVVTAVGANGGGTFNYGDPVTLTANGSGNLRWWTKTTGDKTEIVGFGSDTYSFYAWETCTVTAVYGDAPVYTGNAMKILIDTFDTNSVMAEFLGFGNAKVLEKGIMFGTQKIAMTTDNMQFTVVNNSGYDAKGYAIIEEGGIAYEIIDGE